MSGSVRLRNIEYPNIDIDMQSPEPRPYTSGWHLVNASRDAYSLKAPTDDIQKIKVEYVWDWVFTKDDYGVSCLKKKARPYIVNENNDSKIPRLIVDNVNGWRKYEIMLGPLALQSLEMYENGKIPMPTIDDINKLNSQWDHYRNQHNNMYSGYALRAPGADLQLVPAVPEEPKKKQRKFYVGEEYQLRLNNLDGSPAMEYHFTCKKFINEIAGTDVNVLIMKRLGVYRYRSNEKIFVDNSDSLIYTLNKNDCKMYHIKYEPGLEVWPMSMKWIACNKDKEEYDL